MSENLNYGYVKPTAGDESAQEWMDIISNDIERLADHSHNGDNSSLIDSNSLSRFEPEIVSGKTSCTGLTYSTGDTVIDIGVATATAGMYVEGDDINYEAYITGVTGTEIGINIGVTGDATGDGEIAFSRWKRKASSNYEYELELPSGYTSRTSNYNFYVSNPGDTYENYQTFPTVIVNDVNTIRVQVNKSSYNLKVVVL